MILSSVLGLWTRRTFPLSGYHLYLGCRWLSQADKIHMICISNDCCNCTDCVIGQCYDFSREAVEYPSGWNDDKIGEVGIPVCFGVGGGGGGGGVGGGVLS